MKVSEADLEKRVSSIGDSLRKCSQEKMEKKKEMEDVGQGRARR